MSWLDILFIATLGAVLWAFLSLGVFALLRWLLGWWAARAITRVSRRIQR